MVIANFNNGESGKTIYGLYQWDYGQVLRIQGLKLPAAAEIHFALSETAGIAQRRIGVTKDGITDVVIPDLLLENEGTTSGYNIYAFVYVSDVKKGETERKIIMKVKSRPKPEAFDAPGDEELFHKTIEAVNEAVQQVSDIKSETQIYSEQAKEALKNVEDNLNEISGHVTCAKKDIDEYASEKEKELKGETGDVSFVSFKVEPPKLFMFNDKDKTHIKFTRQGSKLYYQPVFPERN